MEADSREALRPSQTSDLLKIVLRQMPRKSGQRQKFAQLDGAEPRG